VEHDRKSLCNHPLASKRPQRSTSLSCRRTFSRRSSFIRTFRSFGSPFAFSNATESARRRRRAHSCRRWHFSVRYFLPFNFFFLLPALYLPHDPFSRHSVNFQPAHRSQSSRRASTSDRRAPLPSHLSPFSSSSFPIYFSSSLTELLPARKAHSAFPCCRRPMPLLPLDCNRNHHIDRRWTIFPRAV
jgi:hypothetical protein